MNSSFSVKTLNLQPHPSPPPPPSISKSQPKSSSERIRSSINTLAAGIRPGRGAKPITDKRYGERRSFECFKELDKWVKRRPRHPSCRHTWHIEARLNVHAVLGDVFTFRGRLRHNRIRLNRSWMSHVRKDKGLFTFASLPRFQDSRVSTTTILQHRATQTLPHDRARPAGRYQSWETFKERVVFLVPVWQDGSGGGSGGWRLAAHQETGCMMLKSWSRHTEDRWGGNNPPSAAGALNIAATHLLLKNEERGGEMWVKGRLKTDFKQRIKQMWWQKNQKKQEISLFRVLRRISRSTREPKTAFLQTHSRLRGNVVTGWSRINFI